jgi:hypothetical protein
MHLKALFITLLLVQALKAAPPASRPAPTGHLHLSFTERSPFSPIKQMATRPSLTRFAADEKKLEYDLAQESFEAVIPRSYKPARAQGLFVFISADKAEIPPAWIDTLARRDLIFISANNSGNRRLFPARMGRP